MTVFACPQIWPLAALLAYPVYLLMMTIVLRVSGVSKADTAAWALRQAERQRFLDLIRSARGLPGPAPDDKP